jgi:enamine deaminase RidA (YjgF/YER057c/UK114 family)
VKPIISKTHCDTEIATLSLPTHAEHCITVQSSGTLEMSRSLRRAAADCDATVLSQFVFAGTHHYEEFRAAEETADWPVVWLQGDACKKGDIYSMQGVALSGLNPKPIQMSGRDMGFVYEDEYARYCRLRGVIPQNLEVSRSEQTRSAFKTIELALRQNGFEFTDVARTWIYLDDLLEWYDEFNVVRTQFFNETGIFDHMVPASTGIGAANQYGAAIMMDVLAVQPKSDDLLIQEIPSPLQNPALDYKSSFSRAVEMAYPTHRNILISGTASIDPDGATVHLDDAEKQIRLTMDVVHAILTSRGMGWDDLFRGIAYFKNIADLETYRKVADELEIPPFPLAISHADVCRDDLLFEIEVDAVQVV